MITHYDLFAGIGGFSIALEEVFYDEEIKHIFCEWEQFPTAVLKQHWPDGEFWGDIKDLVAYTGSAGLEKARSSQSPERSRGNSKLITNTERQGRSGSLRQTEGRNRLRSGDGSDQSQSLSIVTGGFPCQPFSHAGRRKGTADDRYQWPNMFEVIRNVKPEWVIAENVRGLVTWNEGMVLETVCADLESEGYEVQPFIIPAVAVGAPHRRDRVWIIGHCNTNSKRLSGTSQIDSTEARQPSFDRTERRHSDATNTRPQRWSEGSGESIQSTRLQPKQPNYQYPDWSRNWQEVAFATCNDTVDDGLSRFVDGVPYSPAKWRKDSLKAYGNGIVSQVAMQIMKGIKESQ